MSPSLSYSFAPKYLSGTSSWVAHLPFAYELIRVLEPGVFVELGTWNGDSFFTFCQSVAENRLRTVCYAVDHWKGDDQAGSPDSAQYHRVQSYCSENYRDFAYLMQTDFTSASREFSDGQIELLHIDGLHTYEAVSSDFETWFPKVRNGGVILFHDICVRSSDNYQDFGVWKFWDELKSKHQTFEFGHGYGLGILVKGENAPAVAWLKSAMDESKSYFSRRGVDLQRIVESVGTQERLQERLQQMTADRDAHAEAGSRLAGELQGMHSQLQQVQQELSKTRNAIEEWNGGSWFRRAFHKFRTPK